MLPGFSAGLFGNTADRILHLITELHQTVNDAV